MAVDKSCYDSSVPAMTGKDDRLFPKWLESVYIPCPYVDLHSSGLPNLLGSTPAAYSLTSPYGTLHVSICVSDVYDTVHPDFRKVRFAESFLEWHLHSIRLDTEVQSTVNAAWRGILNRFQTHPYDYLSNETQVST